MAYSFDTSLSEDKDKVRFNIGDTSDDGHYLENETIQALIASEGSVGAASVACVEYIITQLSAPDFKLDWLSVTNATARAGFESLLLRLRQRYGIYNTTTTAVSATNLFREDSDQIDGDYA